MGALRTTFYTSGVVYRTQAEWTNDKTIPPMSSPEWTATLHDGQKETERRMLIENLATLFRASLRTPAVAKADKQARQPVYRSGYLSNDVTFRAVVVRQTKPFGRKDGSYVRFDENAVVLIEKQGKEMAPKGNRIFGPVPRELDERGWHSIVALAPEVV